MVMTFYTTEIKNPVVRNPVDKFVYVDNPKVPVEEIKYDTPIMNGKLWYETNHSQAGQSKIASDPLALSEIFVNNGKEETNYADIANSMFQDLHKARITRDKSLAAAIITS